MVPAVPCFSPFLLLSRACSNTCYVEVCSRFRREASALRMQSLPPNTSCCRQSAKVPALNEPLFIALSLETMANHVEVSKNKKSAEEVCYAFHLLCTAAQRYKRTTRQCGHVCSTLQRDLGDNWRFCPPPLRCPPTASAEQLITRGCEAVRRDPGGGTEQRACSDSPVCFKSAACDVSMSSRRSSRCHSKKPLRTGFA